MADDLLKNVLQQPIQFMLHIMLPVRLSRHRRILRVADAFLVAGTTNVPSVRPFLPGEIFDEA
jgi:hypothetical protein